MKRAFNKYDMWSLLSSPMMIIGIIFFLSASIILIDFIYFQFIRKDKPVSCLSNKKSQQLLYEYNKTEDLITIDIYDTSQYPFSLKAYARYKYLNQSKLNEIKNLIHKYATYDYWIIIKVSDKISSTQKADLLNLRKKNDYKKIELFQEDMDTLKKLTQILKKKESLQPELGH